MESTLESAARIDVRHESGVCAMSETPPLPERLERCLEDYREVFRRRDQARWAAVYVQGLLPRWGERTSRTCRGR